MNILHQLFVRVHARYTRSPHAGDLAAFARWLTERDYPARHAQRLVFRVRGALDASKLRPGGRWSEAELERAFRHARQKKEFREAGRVFAGVLRAAGRLEVRRADGPHAATLAAYRRHLVEVRGLAPATVTQHLEEAGGLLRRCLPGGEPLRRLTVAGIEQHVRNRSGGVSRGYLRTVVGCLRAFLRHCFDNGLVPGRLDVLDLPVRFRDERPPRALDWPLVRRLLRSVPRSGRTGWRDFMILHLLAHYGLRTGEVTRLELGSIDWTNRTLLVEQFKTRSWLTLPLMDETVDLLRRYLKEGKRPSGRDELFLCACAPLRPMTNCAVSQMFKIRARRSGLPVSDASSYALRHSFAMRLLARGVGLKAIGDLMGHGGIASTAVYLRLQTHALRGVSLPVPLSEGGAA